MAAAELEQVEGELGTQLAEQRETLAAVAAALEADPDDAEMQEVWHLQQSLYCSEAVH